MCRKGGRSWKTIVWHTDYDMFSTHFFPFFFIHMVVGGRDRHCLLPLLLLPKPSQAKSARVCWGWIEEGCVCVCVSDRAKFFKPFVFPANRVGLGPGWVVGRNVIWATARGIEWERMVVDVFKVWARIKVVFHCSLSRWRMVEWISCKKVNLSSRCVRTGWRCGVNIFSIEDDDRWVDDRSGRDDDAIYHDIGPKLTNFSIILKITIFFLNWCLFSRKHSYLIKKILFLKQS